MTHLVHTKSQCSGHRRRLRAPTPARRPHRSYRPSSRSIHHSSSFPPRRPPASQASHRQPAVPPPSSRPHRCIPALRQCAWGQERSERASLLALFAASCIPPERSFWPRSASIGARGELWCGRPVGNERGSQIRVARQGIEGLCHQKLCG